MPKPRILRVFPNPFASLDGDGEPAGAIPRADLRSILIGASIDIERSQKEGATKYRFALDEPVELPDIDSHRNALRDGDLLPADPATAAKVGLAFLERDEAFVKARAKAAVRWRAETGEDPPPFVLPAEAKKAAQAEAPAPSSPTAAPAADAPAPPAAPAEQAG